MSIHSDDNQGKPPGALTTGGANDWAAVPVQSGRYIRGTRITNNGNTGAFVINKVEADLSARTFLVTGVTSCWVRRDQSGFIADILVTKPGHPHPREADLPQIPADQWPSYEGQPQKPWKDTRYLYLADPQTAEEFTLVLNTWRGCAGVGELANAVINMRIAHPGAFPIVSITTEPAADRFGIKPKPKFVIIEWKLPASKSLNGTGNGSAEGAS
jgi:hypothetical protein